MHTATAADDSGVIELRTAGRFDPLRSSPAFRGPIPERPEELPGTPSGYRYLLVQFHDPVDAALQESLLASGYRIASYLRSRSLVIGVPPGGDPADLISTYPVRFAGPFEAGFKLDPGLFGLLGDETAHPSEVVSLRVQLFPGESPDPLLAALDQEVRTVHLRRGGPQGNSRLILEIARGRLRSLTGLLLHFPTVAYVERLAPIVLHNDDAVWTGQSYDRVNGPAEAAEADPKPYTDSATLWSHGLLGTNQVIAVADTGLEHGTCFWDDPAHPVVPQSVPPPGALTVDTDHRRILALNGVNPTSHLDDGTWRHGTHVAGTVLGDDLANPASDVDPGHDHGDGMAPDARLVFEDISIARSGSCSATLFVPDVEDLLEQEYAGGARISTNSWGEADTRAGEVDTAVWNHEDFLVVFSAGNGGDSGVSPIAAFKNGIAVGATENHDPDYNDIFGILDPENMAAYSSVGPAGDGRFKPDITAPGYRVFSNNFPTQYHSDEADCDPGDPTVEVCFPTFGGCYFTYTAETCSVNSQTGTSMAAPVVAGLAALARQYFTEGFHPGGNAEPADARTPSAALLKAVLVNGARNMTGRRYERRGATKEDLGPLADAPSGVQGWGRVMLDDALYFEGETRRLMIEDRSNAGGLATSETGILRFHVSSADEPLKVILAWTDPPAPSYAGVALLHDLDLELTAPDGTAYRGNQWTADDINIPGDKESMPDAAGRDTLNNVEGILIDTPQIGMHTLTVRAVDVPGHQGVYTQGFGLAVTGVVAVPAGAVPDGANVAGTPLTVDKAGDGDIVLNWGESCLAGDDDYTVYEGTIGSFGSHASRICSTGGETGSKLTPASSSSYYLVVPRNAYAEGSYGTDSEGSERPAGDPACMAQAMDGC